MYRLWTIAAVVFSGVAVSALAGDLAKIDRTIAKLPALKSDHPEYCLLVFGADLHKRVWLVHDGDVLYVDRNGNGDLTEPGERIAADPEFGDPKDGVYRFKAGNIPDDALIHKDLQVTSTNLSFEAGTDAQVRKLLDANPRWRGHRITIDVEIPGQHGAGFDGRVGQVAASRDANGPLQFAARPEDAPIVHFGGHWEITFYGKDDWHIGSLEPLYLSVGTTGLGPGTTAFIEYQGVVPLGVNPMVEVTYPAATAGESGTAKSYELTKRCCGVNLYGNVQVPADVATGLASVTLSLPGWPGTSVASTTHTITIVPPKPPIKLDPVSWRIKGSLAHVNKGRSDRACIVEIQYSLDGKRLIAGDYDSGATVQTWDVASGQKLVAIAVGPGHPSNYEFFAISPDWKFVYTPTIAKDCKTEKIEKDGKRLMRWTFGDSVQVFDLNTGKLLREFQSSPRRAISYIRVTPDGGHFITLDELPGEYENGPQSTWTLWNSQTGEPREFLDRRSGISLFSADSKTAVVDCPKSPTDSTYTECLKVLDFPACTERTKIALGAGVVSACPLAFAAGGKTIVGMTTTAENRSNLKLWDKATGRELCSVPAREKSEQFARFAKTSPDSKTIAILNAPDSSGDPAQRGGVYLLDATNFKICYVDLGADVIPQVSAFHPDGKWVVVAAVVVPKSLRSDPDPMFTELPQPRLYAVDVASGQIVETMIAPQSFLNSLAFSPDGKTLATSGPGEVLLWDFSTPPGEKRN